MEEHKENQVTRETEKRIKQQITVPFVWEERPGAPKKDWKPTSKPKSPVVRPLKYVASVPFKWEEKPGTPLQCFASETKDQPQVPETVPENRRLPLPPAFFANIEYYDSDDDEVDEEEEEDSFDGDDYDDDVDPDWTSIWGSEAQTEESFSTAVQPLQNPFVNEPPVDHTPPGSPESCRSPSNNYAAGNNATSLRGATFLEYLFPMIPPKSEEKVPVPKRQPLGLDENSKKLGGDCGRSGAIRRPLTLQELIMLSRRRSHRRKALHMKKQNPTKAFTNKRAHGCFSFGASGGGITTRLGKDLQTLTLA